MLFLQCDFGVFSEKWWSVFRRSLLTKIAGQSWYLEQERCLLQVYINTRGTVVRASITHFKYYVVFLSSANSFSLNFMSSFDSMREYTKAAVVDICMWLSFFHAVIAMWLHSSQRIPNGDLLNGFAREYR